MILVGERLATVPGRPDRRRRRWPRTTGARLAWVPRRAGDRGAVETGCLPNLLPGGRPVADAAARVDAATAWGVDALPETAGRDADAIVAALAAGELGGLVVGGVDPDDTSRPGRHPRRARGRALRGRPRAARDRRDPGRRRGVPGRPGHRQGRHVRELGGPAAHRSRRSSPTRPSCPTCGSSPASPRSWAPARLPHRRRGPRRDGARWVRGTASAPRLRRRRSADRARPDRRRLALATWKQLLDNGSMQDGDKYLRATARRRSPRSRRPAYDALGPDGHPHR